LNKKTKIIFFLLTVLLAISCRGPLINTTTPAYSNTIVINENNQPVLLGYCSQQMLLEKPFSNWFLPNYNNAKTDSITIVSLKTAFKKKNIEIFAGTWCGESKADLPQFLKILKDAAVDSSQVKIIFLNNTAALYKQSPQHEEAGKNIVRTPTYIIYNGKKEMGRIIDSPIESFEKDLLKILRNEPYLPHFYDLKL
jgi:thiol-disulfide isomerase/thioredoxin